MPMDEVCPEERDLRRITLCVLLLLIHTNAQFHCCAKQMPLQTYILKK